MMEKDFAMIPQEVMTTPFWILSGKFKDFDFVASDEEGNKIDIKIKKSKAQRRKVLSIIFKDKKWARAYVTYLNKSEMIYGRILGTTDLIIFKRKSGLEFNIIKVRLGWPFYNILLMQYNNIEK